jgi:cysteine desulfurase family protein (TIGR01976 family)
MHDPVAIRRLFPSLAQRHDGRPVVFFDSPGGTQCPQPVIDAVAGYLTHDNANHGGAFATSRRSDAMLVDAHQAMADMLGATSADEIVFGPNMTTLTFGASRALGRRLSPGDELVVTRLDHDANVAPWLHVAADRGATVRWVDVHTADCTLDLSTLEAQLSSRTKVVAVGYASNAVGTINEVGKITRLAHAAGALVFVDGVQYAPHGVIDVQAVGCDFLACSPYKFYGPHVGVLYGRRDLLDDLEAYKVRPALDRPPDKFETGTLNHEGIAGTRAAVEYLASLADDLPSDAPRARRVQAGLAAIRTHERDLCGRLLEGLNAIEGLRIRGIADPCRLDERVPTVSFTLDRWQPRQMAQHLAERGVFAWSGHFYAVALAERLGLGASGMLRVGLAHYNTADEVDLLLDELRHMRRMS